jgi:YVTN family beta-propeller protein
MGRRAVLLAAAAAGLAATAAGGRGPAAPAAPEVTGPRSTTSTRPVYGFTAARAVRFRCSFDTTKLHACAARYSQTLKVGAHTLRAQAVGRTGKKSRVTSVRVSVTAPPEQLPSLPIGATVTVGRGAGAPAVGAGSVWVPNTADATLSRVDATTNAVTATIRYGAAGQLGDFYDSAAVGFGSVWVASDEHATVTRIDPATNQVIATIPVASRPAQITVTSDAVWVAHFLQPLATRIDPATNATTQIQVATSGAPLTGAGADGSTIWLLVNQPQTLLHLDAAGHELVHADDTPTARPIRTFLAAWWVAVGEGGVWTTHPNQNVLTRSDASSGAVVATVPVEQGRLFGVAAGGGSVWAVTDEALVRVDSAAGKVVAKATLPKASPVGFTGVAVGSGAVWATNYDRGELYRIAS